MWSSKCLYRYISALSICVLSVKHAKFAKKKTESKGKIKQIKDNGINTNWHIGVKMKPIESTAISTHTQTH